MVATATARKPTREAVEDGPVRMTVAVAREKLADLVLRAGYGGEVTVLVRREEPTAVIIGFKEYECLRALEKKDERK